MQHQRPFDAAAHAAHPRRARITLASARATSNALLERPAITGLEVTELHGHEADLQWRLAVALAEDSGNAFCTTEPAGLLP